MHLRSSSGAGNSVDLYLKYRDGATVASASVTLRVVLYFSAAPA